MAKNGEHKGGRPVGSTTKPQFGKYVTHKDREKFSQWVLANYQKDINLAKWLGDQIYGKAQSSVELTTDGKELPTPILQLPKE